jgi:sugar (pentulose or hexulose) kinase
MPIPVIAVLDIGKTNKKFLLFDETYQVRFEKCETLKEGRDDDGDPCEDIDALIAFVQESLRASLVDKMYEIKAVNFSGYGASLVYLDDNGRVSAPLYNYLKRYPEWIRDRFYQQYGPAEKLSLETASPVLESLNSGMQLYRIKYEKPQVFERIRYALHLPQFLSYLVSGKPFSDISSIGCHTKLWDFANARYHSWVVEEDLEKKFAPIVPADHVSLTTQHGHSFLCGVGLHDSSAALIPYFQLFTDPFVLISTGTWCITLNPFNHEPLTQAELSLDCLCYMSFTGNPVKASRLFSGYEFEQQIKRIASHYTKDPDYYQSIRYNPEWSKEFAGQRIQISELKKESDFASRDLSSFQNDEHAYHQFMFDLARQQFLSTSLVLGNAPVKKIFVDGGFSRNEVFMGMLAALFPDKEVYAALMSQGTSLGAALAIHNTWNTKPVPADLVRLIRYSRHEHVA